MPDPFDDLVDRARADDAARARSRERWLRQEAAESATLQGSLLDLAEAGATVLVTTVAGRSHRGEVTTVASDFVAVRTSGATVLVALDAIVSVRPDPSSRAAVASGDRPAPVDLVLREALADAAAERPRVSVASRTPTDPVTGELRAVGLDVLTVVLDGDERGVCFVALHSLSTVSFLASG